MTRRLGIGAQFGGKYYCHDVRVVRLPRHAASCPVGLGVSCSADRQAKLEHDVQQYIPEVDPQQLSPHVVKLDINRPMSELRATLTSVPVTTRLSLTGTMVVARDIAHAKLQERLDAGQPLPDYFKNHMIYYAGKRH
ncbi:unnamed protein product [Sphagnum jensenii]|uniref:Fe-S hydro-lyase tartrate dehydratase beta-type catalytic domain-containing protein n=1 Tax=Sphagnum jensenii TaxID=128206 RepID=A0ABP0VDG6_9BRYO